MSDNILNKLELLKLSPGDTLIMSMGGEMDNDTFKEAVSYWNDEIMPQLEKRDIFTILQRGLNASLLESQEEQLEVLKEDAECWNKWRKIKDRGEIDLRWADLRGKDMRGFNFQGVNFDGARCDCNTRWPDGFDISQLRYYRDE